jgi:hypothetical protein
MKKKDSLLTTIESLSPQNNDIAIHEVAEQIIQRVKDGHESAAKTVAKMRFLSFVFDRVEEIIHEDVLHELQHAPEKEGVQVYGFRIKRKNTGGKYDYQSTNHPVYTRVIEDLKPLLEKKKELEDVLKAIKSTMTIVDETTGESCTVTPPVKVGERTSFEVSRK